MLVYVHVCRDDLSCCNFFSIADDLPVVASILYTSGHISQTHDCNILTLLLQPYILFSPFHYFY